MMKAFLIVVSSLCLCGILLCFWAYATGNFPMSKTTQPLPVLAFVEQSTTGETDPQCPLCRADGFAPRDDGTGMGCGYDSVF